VNRRLLEKSAVFCALVGLGVAVRLVSETPNFSAAAATVLFAGFYFRHRTTAICVPLAIMTLSDYFLGGYAKPMMVAVYGSLLIPIAWRSRLRTGLTPARVGLGAVSSSLAFYLLTNAAVWLMWYPATWQSLLRCYTVALPFFVNTLTGDVFFAAGIFGLYALATRASNAAARVLAPQAAG
jgi:hypothetical protein